MRGAVASAFIVLGVVLASPGVVGGQQVGWQMGPGWAVHDVEVTSGFVVTLELAADGPAALGILVYDTMWRFVGGISASRGDSGAWVSVSTDADRSPVYREILVPSARDGLLGSTLAGAGRFHVLTFVVGEGASVTTTITSEDVSAEIVRSDMGDGTFYESGEGARAPLGVRAHAAPAHVVVDAHAEVGFRVTRGLIALIGLEGSPVSEMNVTLQTPTGERQCPCILIDWPTIAGAGPGEYTVTRTGIAVERASTRPLIMGIDID